MPKNQVCRNIAKINNLHCRLKCNISSPGEWVNGFLYVGSTSGSVSTIAVSVMIWNETKVFCKLINGVKGYISSISYIQETNSISLFVEMIQYANIVFAPTSIQNSSSLETVSSIPSDAINLDFWRKTNHKIDLGGLIGINDTWFRFIFVLTVDSEEKSKSLTENGFYICVNESVSPYDNTFLIVLSAQNDNTVVQFLVSANGKSVKVRTKWWGDGWSEWNLIGSWYK